MAFVNGVAKIVEEAMTSPLCLNDRPNGNEHLDGNERLYIRSKEKGMPKSGKVDEAKGRLKEAAGVLRDDKEQQRQGQTDQSVAKLRQAGEKLGEAVGDLKGALKK